jgi:hypothetical protein
MSIDTTTKNNGELIYAVLLCCLKKIALSVRLIKQLSNGKYFIEEWEIITYNNA